MHFVPPVDKANITEIRVIISDFLSHRYLLVLKTVAKQAKLYPQKNNRSVVFISSTARPAAGFDVI